MRVVEVDILILGAGTIGCYLSSVLKEENCVILDCGLNSKDRFKRDEEINTDALSHGRYFGIGGTSNLWGGQIIFDRNLAAKYRVKENHINKVAAKLQIPTKYLANTDYGVNGYWLPYWKRSLKYLISKRHNIYRDVYVESIRSKNEKYEIIGNKGSIIFVARKVHVCLGAFESARFLFDSKLLLSNRIDFNDHISVKFKEKYTPKNFESTRSNMIFKGGGFLTYRYLPESTVGMFHEIFNNEEGYMEVIKSIYSRDISFKSFNMMDLCKGLLFLLRSLLKGKVHIDSRELRLDFTTLNGEYGYIEPYNTTDGLRLRVVRKDLPLEFMELRKIHYDFACIENPLVYHPSGIFNDKLNVDFSLMGHPNLYVWNTGIFPNSSSVNNTSLVFALIEKQFEHETEINNIS